MTPAGAPRAVPSLGRRLSTWLALQGLLAALAVCGVVFAAHAWVLHDRQSDELGLKRDVIRRTLADTAASGNLAELRERLDNLVAGHDDISVTVTAAQSGRVVYPPLHKPAVPRSDRLQVDEWPDRWPVDASGVVHVRLTRDVAADNRMLAQVGWTLFAASMAGAAVVSLTGLLIVRRGLRPVLDLSAQVESIAPDEPQLRLDGSAQPWELQPLVERFNALLARVERAYVQLEGFNADVAHELRTPLTTLIGASELALQRDRPAAELREVIAANLEDLRRLAGIINDMLFMSQAVRGATARRSEVASLARSLADILEFHEAALHDRGLSAVCVGDAAGAFDVALLRRAVSNLLGNAGRYARPGSVVEVRIAADRGRTTIAVANEGETIAEHDLPRIFDRFYRAERSRRRSGAHFGLGLAIVAAIARMHGGESFAQSRDGRTTIGITIPAAA